ncbi:MAG: penicillin-binding protein [Prevotella sp.]|nr:penicillin-binding protein [Prevotella sp.]
MREDDFQILGTDAKRQKRHRRIKILLTVIGVVALVVITELSFRYLVLGVGESKEEAVTTIDPVLQHSVDSLLNNKLEEINGVQGQVIVMEVQSGEILAMAGRERRFDGKFQPCCNFAYQQVPGATMKTAALLALLETGKVSLTDVVDTENGIWEVDDQYMNDHNWRRGGYGEVTLGRALEVSSNIGISKTVRKVFKGRETEFFELLDKMSFGKPDSIKGVEGLCPMLFSSPKDSGWASRQLLWNSIGYERKMAPIQMLTFYNAIANDGKMVKPTLQKGHTEVLNEQIAKKENIAEIQHALYNVVYRGLGRLAGSSLVPVAGKTGTALTDSRFEDEGITEFHVSFCGYFPADAPKYSIIVSMNKYGLPASGGGMAGTLFHDIIEWMVAHGMPDVVVPK